MAKRDKRMLKGKLVVFLIGTAVLCGAFIQSNAAADPDYAKWGRVAMQETAKRYRMDILDYKHLGRQTAAAGQATESFRLILNNGSRKFAVTVAIRFELATEKIVQIQFTEDAHTGNRVPYPSHHL